VPHRSDRAALQLCIKTKRPRKVAAVIRQEINDLSEKERLYKEKVVRDHLYEQKQNSIREYPMLPVGYIDLLTPTEIVEVKVLSGWKHAITVINLVASSEQYLQ